MKLATQIIEDIRNGQADALLTDIYVDESLLDTQKERYIAAIEKFISLYGDKEVEVFSAPGRSEVSGNHTDHQHGEVLAAAINLDIIAITAPRDGEIKVLSDDYDLKAVAVDDLEKKAEEEGTSEGLIRGTLARFKELGLHIGGFEAYMTSEVLQGSGLSSSAAFEVMIGTVLSGLYNDMTVSPVLIAQIGQYTENVYFGKPCGLMDQCASSVGALIHIDFKDNDHPIVEKAVSALKNNDFDTFKSVIKSSGDSSYKYLQNIYSNHDETNQAVSIALGLSEDILGDKGVCRVHGGGFAGTIQAFVEDDYVETYKTEIEKYFGEGSCHILKVRKYGGKKVEL